MAHGDGPEPRTRAVAPRLARRGAAGCRPSPAAGPGAGHGGAGHRPARRADAHPDAPARRPILAGLELGIPLDEAVEQAEPEEIEPQQEVADEEWFEPAPEEPEAVAEEAEEAASPYYSDEPEPATIGHLMQRLELGLLRRERPSFDEGAERIQQNNEPAPELDQRLRSAIDDLQRLAARSG